MTDEINKEEKNNKIEKEIEKIDKEYLTKAKDSRDIIDKSLRTFEDTIETIEKEIEKKDINKRETSSEAREF